MKITILGTRGEIKESLPQYARHSGILIDGKLLFDVGEKEFLDYHPKAIFITHLHPDHAYFVRWGHEEIPPVSVPIYAPESPKKATIQSVVKIIEEEITINGYTILPIPTHHSKLVKSVAYLIKKGRKSLLYTGDLIWIDKKYHHFLENLDLVVTEGSFIRKGGMIRRDKETQEIYGHTGIPNLIDLFKHFSRNMVFVHFGAWFYKEPQSAIEAIEKLGKEKDVKAIAGYDGMMIKV